MPLETVIGLPMALSLGLMYGLGPCLVSCLPYMAPVFMARDFGLKRSWQVVLPLAVGRMAGYVSMGLAAGLFGHVFKDGVAAPTVRLVVGCSAVMIGIALLWRRPACAASASTDGVAVPLKRLGTRSEPRTLLPGGLFLMGLSMALTPCAPMGVVLFSSVASGSPVQGAMLGGAFGLGAIVVPSIVFGIGLAYLGQQLRVQLARSRTMIERLAAGMLIFVGLANLVR